MLRMYIYDTLHCEKIRRRRIGMSVVEIMIVAALSSLIMSAAIMLMSRTTRQFKKGTDMLNNQVLMDNIVERLRSDIRGLRKLKTNECDETKFSFFAFNKGREVEIAYEYDPETKTLFRVEGGAQKSDFHGAKQVESLVFFPYPSKDDFRHLNVAMQLISDEKGEGSGSRLSIICQFHSTCLEPRSPFGR